MVENQPGVFIHLKAVDEVNPPIFFFLFLHKNVPCDLKKLCIMTAH